MHPWTQAEDVCVTHAASILHILPASGLSMSLSSSKICGQAPSRHQAKPMQAVFPRSQTL